MASSKEPKYILIIHAKGSKYSAGGDVTFPLRGETVEEAKEFALKMLRGDPEWWCGYLQADYGGEERFYSHMDGQSRAFKELLELFMETEFPGEPVDVPFLDYDKNLSLAITARIVENISTIDLGPLRQKFDEWSVADERRAREEIEREEFERLKKKFG